VRLVAIGGSDAGISAALRAREVDPECDVTVLVADEFPNFSICGIPYFVSGEVPDWRNLAHRTAADLDATGMHIRLGITAERIDVSAHEVHGRDSFGTRSVIGYDALVIGTGALPVRPSIDGLNELGPEDHVHVIHSMGDTFALIRSLSSSDARTAVIIGGGYLGIEMAEALTVRGLAVTEVEQLPDVLPTVDGELGRLVGSELRTRGVDLVTGTVVRRISRIEADGPTQLRVDGSSPDVMPFRRDADIVLIFAGVQPDVSLAAAAGITLGTRGAIEVDTTMRTNLPDVFAAGDCVVTHHRLLGKTYIPLGTTAHKQGRVAGENAVGGDREFAGSLGTQVVKIFEMAAARTGLRDHEAVAAGFDPFTITAQADDHKAYYPGAHRIVMRWTGDRRSGRLLGVQLFGHRNAEVAKRVDIAAAAIFNEMTVDAFSDLDLSYTPPLGSPWEALQIGAQSWVRALGEAKRG
jgi:NADPH-dependent 2,4-dienoyl-CoA reductase/sulfur reductase-like enzyme